MTVFLPHSPRGLPKFEAGLNDQKLSQWLDELQAADTRDTILTLPRMHSEWGKDLKQPLSDMGAPTAFSDSADFSGIASFRGSEPVVVGLKINHVIHKAWLDVDEVGAEAAAATAVVEDIVTTGAKRGPPPPPPVIFRADRPFLYLLRDRSTGLILFMGRYVSKNDHMD
jgi:serpin B